MVVLKMQSKHSLSHPLRVTAMQEMLGIMLDNLIQVVPKDTVLETYYPTQVECSNY